jgi:hypothetical protein
LSESFERELTFALVRDAAKREDAVQRAFKVWQREYPAAAAQYLGSAGWSPERKAKLTAQNP